MQPYYFCGSLRWYRMSLCYLAYLGKATAVACMQRVWTAMQALWTRRPERTRPTQKAQIEARTMRCRSKISTVHPHLSGLHMKPRANKANCARPTQQQQQHNSTTDRWTCLQANYLHHRSPAGSPRGSKAGQGQMQLCKGPPPLLRSLSPNPPGPSRRAGASTQGCGRISGPLSLLPWASENTLCTSTGQDQPSGFLRAQNFSLCLSNWAPRTRNDWTILWLFC